MRAPMLFVLVVGGLGAGCFVACSNETFQGGESDASADDAASDGSPGDAPVGTSDAALLDAAIGDAAACTSLHGPNMITVPGSSHFCIDSTEVTKAQYQAFLDAIAGGYTPTSDPRCSWNKSFVPSSTCTLLENDAGATGPMTCVDWCDAFSFCAWSGKRLCGTIGSTAPLSIAAAADDAVSAWSYACSANGTRTYPYGTTYQDPGCNLYRGPGANFIAPVTSYPVCVGGYPGLFDMAGNAAEWVDACDRAAADASAASDDCVRIGASYEHSGMSPAGQCADLTSGTRNAVAEDVGFRCCSR